MIRATLNIHELIRVPLNRQLIAKRVLLYYFKIMRVAVGIVVAGITIGCTWLYKRNMEAAIAYQQELTKVNIPQSNDTEQREQSERIAQNLAKSNKALTEWMDKSIAYRTLQAPPTVEYNEDDDYEDEDNGEDDDDSSETF